MTSLLIGTSGFSYKDWVGPVYPSGTPAKNYLLLYEKMFTFTELNFSYYHQPNPRTLERMTHITGDDFSFAIKAHRSITHEISNNCTNDIKLFRESIAPLIRAAKLAVVLIQFPFSFHYTPLARKHLYRVCEDFAGIPSAVEFRNREWQRDSVYKGLEKFNIAWVNVDAPDLPGLPLADHIVTSAIAYVRFHGRNAAQWWTGDNASRYDYLYNDQELLEWLPRVQSMAQQSSKIIIAFNNHWRGQAVTNARRIQEIINENKLCG